ncbi:MAG: PrsW family intramembrane metalloprotease [Kiritimatiellae bacterium]|nr:PrsW family intramembrane metalloprotease [Kiritimatiellia bacterium]
MNYAMSCFGVVNMVRDFFSEVFKRHTEDDAEQVVIVGAAGTIPDPDTLASECPRPWLYTRVFMFFMLVTVLLFVANMLTNPGQFSNVFVIGSFAVPFTVLVLFFEFNIFKNISFYTVLKALFIGGALSLIVTAMLPSFWVQGITSVSDAFVAGIGEEIAKLLVVYWILKRNRAYPYVLNGLLVGAAVGAGFAIFETAGYCMASLFGGDNTWLGKESMSVLALRNFLAPGGHVVWAAISGAGLLFAARREPISAGMFRRKAFLGAFLVSVGLHVLWDMPFFESEWGTICHMLFLTLAAWCVVAWFIRRGLEEVDTMRAVVPWRGTFDIPPNPAGACRRWAARFADMLCGCFIVMPVLMKGLEYFGTEGTFNKLNDVIGGVISIPLVLLLEAVVFELFGTTFGKWAFSIRVQDSNGHPVSSWIYFKRLVRLWASGLGFGLPVVSLIVPWIQYRKVRSGFNATYDESLGLRVDKERFHPLRWIVVLPVLIVVVGLPIVGVFAGEDDTAQDSSTHADVRLERLVSSAGLKCEWTENGICVIPFETSEAPRRTQTCLAFFETEVSSGAEGLLVCSMVAKCDAVERSIIDEMLTANATMEARQWCKVGNDLALRAFLPLKVSPQEFRDVAARLAEDADSFEKRLTGKDEF